MTERLRRVIGEMRGTEKIVCEVNPRQHIDVVPSNARIHGLLEMEGCSTQVRHEHLGRDGYHIAPPSRAGDGCAVWVCHSRMEGPLPLLGQCDL